MFMKLKLILFSLVFCGIGQTISFAQKKNETPKKPAPESSTFNGLKFRSIGPAFMSGRIADIAFHPDNENIWYVAIGSGGVWKTENAGTTWSPIFDGQKSYSIGCIALDPQNPNIVWVGTGENVGGRHVGFGDGIYKSEDGGQTWKHKGLPTSEHISKIVVHPSNSNVLWVASQGPLWSSGGERGVFMSTDGGATWTQTLGDKIWVGATDLLIDPRNPDVLYAATWQRHRTVAGYMGGGPGTAIYRSDDGGKTWTKLENGLPNSNMGKIGLAISPQNPDVIYAAIELDRRKGGVYKSTNKGASWTKMSDAVSGGTGPHYYQELYASPHQFDLIYLADNYLQVSEDGGKTFKRVNVNNKHVDDHAVAFKKNDPNYIMVGSDGGLYESFDNTKTWKFIDNLPVTQIYKVAIDDAEPFYNVYGGTQDNNTQGGPSRTDNVHGIRNSDWFVVLGGDGHQPATEPGNPNIVYAQWQQGNLTRHDRSTSENVYIQPQARIGEKTERYNWDAPILVSPHKPTRLYFASQRVWKSEDRGDTWTPISGDLTNNIERVSTPFFGQTQKWDNPWDIYAMSNYSTITSLAESPIKAGLIYVGTDDGIIQVTENDGQSWRKIEYSRMPGLPKTAFVNDIKADLFDENTVYAVFDNHKYGDYKPYIYKSTDKGTTWKSIVSNLPERTLLWRVVQDHIAKDLMFLGTEFGVYFTQDGGATWTQMKGGLPNIAVRDLAIHKRENDLVLATFGRGFYVLDDYSALRNINAQVLDKEATLFAPRKALWYKQRDILGGGQKAFQGDAFYCADNPPFGVQFTYYLKEAYSTKEAARTKAEKNQEKENKPVGVPTWEILESEKREIKPSVWLFITNNQGEIIRKMEAINSAGIQRVTWDFSTESPVRISPDNVERNPSGTWVSPGLYDAQLFKRIDGKFSAISEKVEVQVVPMKPENIAAKNLNEVAAFWSETQSMSAKARALSEDISNAQKNVDVMIKAYERAPKQDVNLENDLMKKREQLLVLEQKLGGSKARSEVGEKEEFPTLWTYLYAATWGTNGSTYGPTPMHREYMQNAETIYNSLLSELTQITADFSAMKEPLKNIGAPEMKD